MLIGTAVIVVETLDTITGRRIADAAVAVGVSFTIGHVGTLAILTSLAFGTFRIIRTGRGTALTIKTLFARVTVIVAQA